MGYVTPCNKVSQVDIASFYGLLSQKVLEPLLYLWISLQKTYIYPLHYYINASLNVKYTIAYILENRDYNRVIFFVIKAPNM